MDILLAESRLGVGLLAGLGCGVVVGWFIRKACVVDSQHDSVEENISASIHPPSAAARQSANWKMVLVVRTDLKMGKGKAAAQCCHAAVACCKMLLQRNPQGLTAWERNGQPKVVVKVETEEELIELAGHAQQVGLQSYLVQDAGRTQVEPGSRTVLGVGPGPAELIDEVTGHLKLY